MFAPPPTIAPIPNQNNTFLYVGLAVLVLIIIYLLLRRETKSDEPAPEIVNEVKEVKEVKEVVKEQPKPKKEGVREAGIAVRDALLNFSVEAEQIAAIVRYTVSILSPSTRPIPPPTPPAPAPVSASPAPSKTHFSVKGLELPVLEDNVEAEPAGEKQGKINADTNPLVLQMVKERK